MSLKLNIGLSRKVGEANYGSRGASVNVELEVDTSLAVEPDKLRERIRQLYGLVRTALAEELNGSNGHDQPRPSAVPAPAKIAERPSGTQTRAPASNGTRYATPAQVKALYALARQHGQNLHMLLFDRQVERPEELTLRQASSLIDQLKTCAAEARS